LNVHDIRETLLTAYRLIFFSRSIFLRFIKPAPLFALRQHPDLSIRYLAIELLSFSIGMTDAAKAKWTEEYLGGPKNAITAPWEHRRIDYGLLPIFESERIRLAKKKIQERRYFYGGGRKLLPTDLGRFTGEICGVLIPRFDNLSTVPSKLVMTENTRLNLRAVADVIVAEKPLLLQSVPGAGKSFLIDETAKLFCRYEGTSSSKLLI
jgi:midasin (ATPase involved in ribosome maturation)